MESLGTLLAQEDDSPPSTSEPAIHHHMQGKDSTKQDFEVQSHQTAYMKNSFTYRTNRVTERCTQANIEKDYTELGYEAIKSKASAKFQARKFKRIGIALVDYTIGITESDKVARSNSMKKWFYVREMSIALRYTGLDWITIFFKHNFIYSVESINTSQD